MPSCAATSTPSASEPIQTCRTAPCFTASAIFIRSSWATGSPSATMPPCTAASSKMSALSASAPGSRKSSLQTQLIDLQTQYQSLQADEEKLTVASQRLQSKVEAFRTQRSEERRVGE